ncbi:MAG: PEP-CTERM sorting domain-containing protein [Verrucomicrobiota bacterium]
MSLHLKLKALIPAALAAVFCGSAGAATYTPGDLLLGFVAGGGQGSDATLVVNLGSASSYRDAFDSGTGNLSVATIGSQLTTQFGAGWYDRTDLFVSLYATPSSSTTSSTLVNQDPARTLYVSQARTDAGLMGSAASGGWTVDGNTIMTTGATTILGTSSRFAATNADAFNVAIIADPDPNTLDEFTRPTTSTSFGAFDGGIEQIFGAGSWGSYGAAGPMEAALDLYRLQARNDVAGQYGQGEAIREGAYTGTFTIGQGGTVSYFSSVPEPGSVLMLGLAFAGTLFGRRRRA